MSSKALLSFEEEKELLKRYCLYRDAEAKLKLLTSHRGLICAIAKRFYNNYKNNSVIDMDDLIQEGYCGFIKAIDEFDINKKNRLATFAVIHIKSEIFKYITRNFGSVHISQYMARRIIEYSQAVSNFKIKNNREPTFAELVKILDCSREFLQNTIQAYKISVFNLYEDKDCLANTSFPENQVLECENDSEREQILKYLYEGFSRLSPSEQEAVKNYYDFNNTETFTQKKLKKRSLPSKIELEFALRKLKKHIIANIQESSKNDLIKEGAVNV